MFTALDSLESILAAAARHGLVLTDTTLDTMGLDFLAVHGADADGNRWILRAPRRADVAEAATIEARTLAAVRDHLPVSVPEWRIAADVIAYPRLPGIPVVTLEASGPVWNGIDPAAPAPAFLAQLGALLAALQRVTGDVPARTIAEERAECARIVQRSRELLSPPDAIFARWQRWVDDDAMWPAYTALSHGDLHPGHMLLEDGALTGVLDWTEARVGDPGVDLAMMVRCFGRGATEAIHAGLVASGGRTWDRAIDHAVERAVMFPAAAADWAARKGNDAILEYARSSLESDIALAERA